MIWIPTLIIIAGAALTQTLATIGTGQCPGGLIHMPYAPLSVAPFERNELPPCFTIMLFFTHPVTIQYKSPIS